MILVFSDRRPGASGKSQNIRKNGLIHSFLDSFPFPNIDLSDNKVLHSSYSISPDNMPPLGIFRRGNSAIPSSQDAMMNESQHSAQNKSSPSVTSPSYRGIFRGLGSSRHGLQSNEQNADPVIDNNGNQSNIKKNLAVVNDEKAQMELEYLNMINSLSKEKEDARDEIHEKMEETKNLSVSNRSLQSKVSDLETQLNQLTKEAEEREKEETERPPVTPKSGKRRPVQHGSKEAKVFTFDSPSGKQRTRTEALDRIKSKLQQHHESNKEINNRVQRIRDKYAKRREEADELSENSSVVSIGSVRSCVSMVTSPLSSPRHHLVEVKKLERNFEKELQKNMQLEEYIKKVTEEKEIVEARLKELSDASTEHLQNDNSGIEELKSQLAEEKARLVESEKALEVMKENRDETDRIKDEELTRLKLEVEKQLIKMKELQDEISLKEAELDKVKADMKSLGRLQTELTSVKEKLEEAESKVSQLGNTATNNDVTNIEEVEEKSNKLDEEMEKVKTLQESMKLKKAKIEQLQGEVEKLQSGSNDQTKNKDEGEQYKDEVARKNEALNEKDKELRLLRKENKECKDNLATLELDFVMTQEKSARYFQEMEDVKEKYESELKRNSNGQGNQTEAANTIASEQLESAERRVRQLEDENKTKEDAIRGLESASGKEVELVMELATVKSELTKLKQDLERREEELDMIRGEKDKSFTKLETIEQDMMVIQRKNSTTFEELEDLKEKYYFEKQEKASLKEQIEQFSPEEIIADAKKETEEALKAKDGEIHDLKKHLTDANVSKAEIELKLMEVMNDVISSQSTRNMMKGELEARLEDENEKALQLETMIKAKEDDIEQMRKEFSDLRIQMEKETDLKLNEIVDLNGEVVEKSSQLSSRDREFLQLEARMDELKLQHKAEISRLRREIDGFGSNEREVQNITRQNQALHREVASLKNEIQRLHMGDRDNLLSADSSRRILRTRNEQLKDEVEKLQKKLRRMRRNVTRIEL